MAESKDEVEKVEIEKPDPETETDITIPNEIQKEEPLVEDVELETEEEEILIITPDEPDTVILPSNSSHIHIENIINN